MARGYERSYVAEEVTVRKLMRQQDLAFGGNARALREPLRPVL
jgi:hypothetical protein